MKFSRKRGRRVKTIRRIQKSDKIYPHTRRDRIWAKTLPSSRFFLWGCC